LAVLPEFRKLGTATLLLNEAINRMENRGIKKLEAWTRDDIWLNDWYKNIGNRTDGYIAPILYCKNDISE